APPRAVPRTRARGGHSSGFASRSCAADPPHPNGVWSGAYGAPGFQPRWIASGIFGPYGAPRLHVGGSSHRWSRRPSAACASAGSVRSVVSCPRGAADATPSPRTSFAMAPSPPSPLRVLVGGTAVAAPILHSLTDLM